MIKMETIIAKTVTKEGFILCYEIKFKFTKISSELKKKKLCFFSNVSSRRPNIDPCGKPS